MKLFRMRTLSKYLCLLYCVVMLGLIIYHNRLFTIEVSGQPELLYQKEPSASLILLTPTTLRHVRDERNIGLSGYGLNVHLWYGLCTNTIEKLCGILSFPQFPALQTITTKTFLTWRSEDFGQRVFGFLHPPKTGEYTFALASDDSSELWLSENESWKNSKLIAHVGMKNTIDYCPKGVFTRFRSQMAENVPLQKGRKYYIEILHTEAGEANRLELVWRRPGFSDFEVIENEYLSPYIKRHWLTSAPYNYSGAIPPSLSCTGLYRDKSWPFQDRKDTSRLSYLNHKQVRKALPNCNYSDAYRIDFDKLRVRQWEAVHKHIHHTYTFPFFTHLNITDAEQWKYPLDKNEANYLAYNYLHRLELKYPK